MTGFSTQAGTPLAGTANYSVDGATYPVVGEAKWQVSTVKRETVTGMDGVHGFKETPVAGYIEVTIRDAGGMTVANFNAMRNNTHTLQLANGKTVVARNAWVVDTQEVDAVEGSFKLRAEGPNVIEIPATS